MAQRDTDHLRGNDIPIKDNFDSWRGITWPQLKEICNFKSIVRNWQCTFKLNKYFQCTKSNCPMWRSYDKVELYSVVKAEVITYDKPKNCLTCSKRTTGCRRKFDTFCDHYRISTKLAKINKTKQNNSVT